MDIMAMGYDELVRTRDSLARCIARDLVAGLTPSRDLVNQFSAVETVINAGW